MKDISFQHHALQVHHLVVVSEAAINKHSQLIFRQLFLQRSSEFAQDPVVLLQPPRILYVEGYGIYIWENWKQTK